MTDKQDQQKLENLENLNNAILHAVGDGIYGIDVNGIGTFTNKAASDLTGWSEEEVIGVISHELWHHSHKDGSHFPKTDCSIYAAAQEGVIKQVDNEVFWKKDGTSFPVEYTSTPLIENDEIIGAVVVFRDISRRKQAEDLLDENFREIRQLKKQLSEENTYLQQELIKSKNFDKIIGNDPALLKTLSEVEHVAPTDATVLINGESGTGKELIAHAIHQLSPRHERPLINVNCAALTEDIVESELFGHEKGAFTGAIKSRVGRFELANGGTLFLDEIAELPLKTQTKILRVLQEQEFEKVGSSNTTKVDVRIIAASHENISELVNQGKFRADLFYRLNVFPLEVPALRHRVSDIPKLVNFFLDDLAIKLKKKIEGVSTLTMKRLKSYSWCGNIRELQNVLERAAILAHDPIIEIAQSQFPGCNIEEPMVNSESNALNMSDMEKNHITKVLDMTNWKVAGAKGAAAILGLHPNTLRSRMVKLEILRD